METNASIDAIGIYLDSDGTEMPWYLGMTASNFTLQGKATADVSLTVVYPEAPEPGQYRIDIVGLDVDNGITYPLSLYLHVLDIPEFRIEYDYTVVPVTQQIQPTYCRVYNDGNTSGLRSFLQASGLECWIYGQRSWCHIGFNQIGAKGGQMDVSMQFTLISYSSGNITWSHYCNFQMEPHKRGKLTFQSKSWRYELNLSWNQIWNASSRCIAQSLFTIENRGTSI